MSAAPPNEQHMILTTWYTILGAVLANQGINETCPFWLNHDMRT
jgi:hypothetical protein